MLSQSRMASILPAGHLAALRKYNSPNNQWESAAYETMEEPSALAPGVTITLVQARARCDSAAVAAASARIKRIRFMVTDILEGQEADT